MIGQSEQKPVWHTNENATFEVKLALFPPDDSSESPGFLTRKYYNILVSNFLWICLVTGNIMPTFIN